MNLFSLFFPILASALSFVFLLLFLFCLHLHRLRLLLFFSLNKRAKIFRNCFGIGKFRRRCSTCRYSLSEVCTRGSREGSSNFFSFSEKKSRGYLLVKIEAEKNSVKRTRVLGFESKKTKKRKKYQTWNSSSRQ